MSRVITICLDGYEYSLAQYLMDAGELPAIGTPLCLQASARRRLRAFTATEPSVQL